LPQTDMVAMTEAHKEFIAIGVRKELQKEIGHKFHQKGPAYTLLLDGAPIAAGGFYCDPNGLFGEEIRLWCISTDLCSRRKLSFVRSAKKLINVAFTFFQVPSLIAYAFWDYSRTTKLMGLLGFTETHTSQWERIKTVRYELRREQCLTQQHNYLA